MGTASSSSRSQEAALSDVSKMDPNISFWSLIPKIDRPHNWRTRWGRRYQVVLLGCSDTGKSTFLKQLMAARAETLRFEGRRIEWRSIIIRNLIQGCKAIIVASKDLGLNLEDDEAIKAAEMILTVTNDTTLSPEVATAIQILLRDRMFLATYQRKSEFDLQDCWKAYADASIKYPSWGGPDWVPSEDECIQAHMRTTVGQVNSEQLIMDDHYEIFDVGGSRAARGRWINLFHVADAIIYFASASEYDQVLAEDSTRNRLVESLELFGEVANSALIKHKSIFVMLNKKDIFLDKFQNKKIPLNISGHFPSAPTDFLDGESALEWIRNQFFAMIRERSRETLVQNIVAIKATSVEFAFEEFCLWLDFANYYRWNVC